MDVIEECSCQGDCYRMSYWESYYEKITDDRGHTKEEEKVSIRVHAVHIYTLYIVFGADG